MKEKTDMERKLFYAFYVAAAIICLLALSAFTAFAQEINTLGPEGGEGAGEELEESFSLPEELGEGVLADNETNEIYCVPQGFTVPELFELLFEAAPDAWFEIEAQELVYGEFLTSGAKVIVYGDGFEPEKEYTVIVKGDATGSGKTTASEARTALRLSVGLAGENEEGFRRALDVDCDGAVTSADARMLLRVSVHLELLGRDIGPGYIKSYSEDAVPLWYPELADELNGAELEPSQTVKVVNYRTADETSWNIYTSEKDITIIDNILAKLPEDASNAEKIYSVYKYLQGEFEYASGDLYAKIWDLSPLQAVVNLHLAQCLQYNGAMAQVLAYMGYDVEIVEGMRGQGDHENDEVTRYWNHYWTELHLNGNAYLIEIGEPTRNWSGAFMVRYADSDGRYLYYNAEKEGYSFLK